MNEANGNTKFILTDIFDCGILLYSVKCYEGVSRRSFSARERKSPAVSFLPFRWFLNFPPELHF